MQTHKLKTMKSLWMVLAAASSFAFIPGCCQANNREADILRVAEVSTIDVGIVFSDQSNYVCIPLTRFRIYGDVEVFSVRTSCDCTRASIVRYCESATRNDRALRLDFVREEFLTNLEPAPVQLAVEVTFELPDGKSALAKIQFLHTIVFEGAGS